MLEKDSVLHIAGLARLHLDPDEIVQLTKDLADILSYIAKLEKLNVTDVEPTSHALPLKNVYRPDETKASLSQEKALSIAVARQDGSFKVPQVIE